MSFPGCSGDKVIRKNVLLLSDMMMMVKVPLICFFSGYVVLVYSVFLHTSFFGLVISATVFGHFKLFCIFYKVHARSLTYLFLPAKQDRNASYFMWYIFLFIYPHDGSCFFFKLHFEFLSSSWSIASPDSPLRKVLSSSLFAVLSACSWI